MIAMSITNNAQWIRFAPMAYVGLALLFVALICIWGMQSDLHHRRELIYNAEISQAKSHAERTVVRIEWELRDGRTLESFRTGNLPAWLIDHWERFVIYQPNRLFAAIQSDDFALLAHSGDIANSQTEGLASEFLGTAELYQLDEASSAKSRNNIAAPIRQFLESGTTIAPRASSTPTSSTPGWKQSVGELEMVSEEVGPIVFRVNDSVLTRGANAIDIRIPIQFESQNVGYYHTAIGFDWLESRIREAQWNPTLAWLAILGSILMIVLASSASLFRLGSRAKQLEHALQVAETRRLADLSRLIVGMAHELRNPLNAVRLNLFTSEKLIRGESQMPMDDAVAMLHESVSEVERVSDIISQLLGYARVRTEERSWLNLDQEIRATLQFMNQIHAQQGIEVQYENLHPKFEVYIEQKCLRQVVLNLLMNARQMMPTGGRIRIQVESRDGLAQMSIDDDGPGIQSDHMEKIFEPFFSTRQEGVGLGLAVVRNLIEAAGGKVICGHSEELDGLSFCIQLPARNVSNVMTTSA